MASAAPGLKDVARDEPQAHALYNRMVAALRAVDSLSYQSHYRWEAGGQELSRGTYRLWMQKPNYARVEALEDGETSGALVLDGEQLWIYWLKERPMFYPGDESEEAWKRTRYNVYMKKPAPPGRHSILHEVRWIGARTILEPSIFHGSGYSLELHLDGIRSLGTELVGDEECDGIEVRFMDHQRSWYLWLSRRDHLPRRLEQRVRLGRDQLMEEIWSNIGVDAPIPEERFTWTAPSGWKEWRPLAFEDTLLKPGTPAPDFSLQGLDGETLALSAFRGNVVWLAIWRAG